MYNYVTYAKIIITKNHVEISHIHIIYCSRSRKKQTGDQSY